MGYVSTAERIGIKKGKQEGLHNNIIDILEIKFGKDGLSLKNSIISIEDIKKLQKIRHNLKEVQTLSEAKKYLEGLNC
ncbi:MAG: hypothetical protein GWN62_15825 [Aliifodinibius sp.]|nr:hypothetical protein [Fodinibius sp.]